MVREKGGGRPRLTLENTVPKILEEGHVKKHEDPPENMYEEIDDIERGERDM